MDIQKFIAFFAALFDDTRFRDLEEWSSFLALSVMAMIKSEYNVAVTAQEMRNAVTIQDLFDTVKSHC